MPFNRWRGLAYVAAGLCGYALFLLITLPAYWADWLVSRASHNAVRIQQPEGTLWGGSGNLVIQSAGQEQMRTRIAWELQTLWLFTGKLQARLHSPDNNPALNATIRAGYHHLSIHDVETTLPVSVLSAFNPAIDLVAPSGRLQITAQQATLTPAGLEGAIQLTWLGAGARMGGLSEAGDYRCASRNDRRRHAGAGAVAQAERLPRRPGAGIPEGEGLVRLTGNVTPGGREQTLRPLLTMLNAQNNNGQYSWTLNNRFPAARFFGASP